MCGAHLQALAAIHVLKSPYLFIALALIAYTAALTLLALRQRQPPHMRHSSATVHGVPAGASSSGLDRDRRTHASSALHGSRNSPLRRISGHVGSTTQPPAMTMAPDNEAHGAQRCLPRKHPPSCALMLFKRGCVAPPLAHTMTLRFSRWVALV